MPGIGRRPLDGRAAIVTGSTSGIGLGIAKALAEAGAAVMLNGFGDPEDIEMQRQSLADAQDVDVAYSNADMSKPEAIRYMVAQAERRFGQVDIVVNNAGIQHVAPIESFPREKWDQIIAINLSSAFHLVQRRLRRHEGTRLRPHRQYFIGPRTDRLAIQVGLCRGQARHCRLHQGDGTRRCRSRRHQQCHLPRLCLDAAGRDARSTTRRSRTRSRATQVIRDVLLKNQPNKRFAAVEEIGALTVFLCSESGQSITGTALPVDGGWTAH